MMCSVKNGMVWDSAAGVMRPIGVGLGVAQLSTDYCASGWSLLNPLAWFGGCVGPDAGQIYQKIQYGTEAPPVVTPPAETVTLTTNAGAPGAIYAGQDTSGQAEYAVQSTAAENQAALVAKQNAAIDAAIAGGYNPYGNLPVNALDFGKIPLGVWIIGGAVVAGLVLGGRRR